jgi:2-polyprenyl-3-methyl-5-hydroxy-6-metoxy-1,4-benzoquinol methylase
MKKLYIDENITVFTDETAEKLLSENNDSIFFDKITEGVHKVPVDRWNHAQKYEKKTWMGNQGAKDDRNFEHLQRFDSFKSLENFNLQNQNVIELGCGPFTNLRLITETLKVSNISLLDPLINDYLNHNNCTYKNNLLNNIPVIIHNTPIESFETEKKFDIVIMINVIEHCYDVDLIFQKIIEILNPGGIFIFSDVFFNDVYQLSLNLYDAGHPLRLSEKKLKEFLKNFNTVYEQTYSKLYSQDWRNDIYFIGKKII